MADRIVIVDIGTVGPPGPQGVTGPAGAGGDASAVNAISALAAQALSVANTASNAASIVSAAVETLSAAHVSLVNRVSANSGGGGGGSVTSAEAQAISAQAQSVHSAFKVSGTVGNLDVTSLLQVKEITPPAAPGADTARIYAYDDNGNTRLAVIFPDGSRLDVTRDNVAVVKNTQGSSITKGQTVYLSGGVGASGTAEVKLARANAVGTMPVAAVVLEASISNNGFGRVMLSGKLEDFDTSAFSEGAIVYQSEATAGLLTATPPSYPDFTQRVGVIINSHASQGSMFVLPVGIRSPDITSALGELSNSISNEASVRGAVDLMLADAISNEMSIRAAADTSLAQAINTLSNQNSVDHVSIRDLVSVVSNAVSIVSVAAAAVSANVTSVANNVESIRSAQSAKDVSINNAISIVSAAAANALSAVSALSNQNSADHVSIRNLISVVSNAVSIVSAAAAAVSANVTSVANNVESIRSAQSAKDVSINNAISVVSNAVSIVSVAAANATSIANAVSNRLSTWTLDNLLNVSAPAPTSLQVLKFNSAAAQWVASVDATGGAGSATVTSNHLSQLSQAISVVSNAASIVSVAAANALSVANAVSNAVSIIAAGLVVSALSRRKTLTDDQVISATAVVSVSGFSWPVVSNANYGFRFVMIFSTSSTPAAPQWQVSVPGVVFFHSQFVAERGTSTARTVTNLAANTKMTQTSSIAATTGIYVAEGAFRVSASNGNLELKVGNAVSGSGVSIVRLYAGSYGLVWRTG